MAARLRSRIGAAAVEDVAVISIPIVDLGLTTGQAIHFYVELFEARTSLDRIPSEGMIELTVPADDYRYS